MAIAGKVAITLSSENGGAWSADVTYDRLVAVKHNNNLYISRKVVTNVEPPNDEFWFLALEGYSGEDVQALIDRMNAIISGTQQVGNAKTLDGHGAEYFLPSDGNKPMTGNIFKWANGYGALSNSSVHSALISFLNESDTSNCSAVVVYNQNAGMTEKVIYQVKQNGVDTNYAILHTGNKPTGTYMGNGESGSRTISVGGIGGVLVIITDTTMAILGNGGFIAVDGSTGAITGGGNAFYANGNLYLSTSHVAINASGKTYTYQVL